MRTVRTYAIWSEHKKYIKVAHRILYIIEIKVKQLQSHHAPLNPC